MKETSKCFPERARRGDFERYLRGRGVDIGAANDPLCVLDGRVLAWDLSNGDGMTLGGLLDGEFDFVYSSHCLEHISDVEYALINWTRILRPGGILYIVVPDFDLYEKRHWPSRFNKDHTATFSLSVTRSDVGSRCSHFNVYSDIIPFLRRYGVEILETRLEDYHYDYGFPPDCDQTLGIASAQVCFIGRKMKRKGTAVFLRNCLGSGDHANLLPAFRYLNNLGYDMLGYRINSLYDNVAIAEPHARADRIEIGVDFKHQINIPATQLIVDIRQRIGVDMNGIVFPGICFNQSECELIAESRKRTYANIFPATSIRQKTIAPTAVRAISEHLERVGLKVMSARVPGKDDYPWEDLFKHFHPYRERSFDRRWLLDIAGASINVCCDGGSLNASLAAGAPTLGLMTIADSSLMTFYPKWQWRAVQSTFPCSPCFRPANYDVGVVVGCEHFDNYCGQHFSLDEIRQCIDELVQSSARTLSRSLAEANR